METGVIVYVVTPRLLHVLVLFIFSRYKMYFFLNSMTDLHYSKMAACLMLTHLDTEISPWTL